MREAEIATMDEKYKERKPLPKSIMILGYVLVAILLVLTLMTKSHFFLILFLTVFSAVVNYETNMTTIRFNPQPEVFSSLLLAKVIGFPYALIMLILPTLVVDVYTARLDKDTFISLVLTAVASFLISKFMIGGFVFFGVLLILIKLIIGVAINLILDISMQEIVFEHFLGFISNLLILLVFGNFFFYLFYNPT